MELLKCRCQVAYVLRIDLYITHHLLFIEQSINKQRQDGKLPAAEVSSQATPLFRCLTVLDKLDLFILILDFEDAKHDCSQQVITIRRYVSMR